MVLHGILMLCFVIFHDFLQTAVCNRFFQNVFYLALGSTPNQNVGGMGRKDIYTNLRIGLMNNSAGFQTGDSRHLHIHEYNINHILFTDTDRTLTGICHGNHFESTILCNHHMQRFAHQYIIICYQNPVHDYSVLSS